jgi:hypothetical protein
MLNWSERLQAPNHQVLPSPVLGSGATLSRWLVANALVDTQILSEVWLEAGAGYPSAGIDDAADQAGYFTLIVRQPAVMPATVGVEPETPADHA